MISLEHTCPKWALIKDETSDVYHIFHKKSNKRLAVEGPTFRTVLDTAAKTLAKGVTTYTLQVMWKNHTLKSR